MIPPLRERAEDIPVLALRFAMRNAAEIGKKIDGIAPGRAGGAAEVPVARQHPRAAACDRAGGHPHPRSDDPAALPGRDALRSGPLAGDAQHATTRPVHAGQHAGGSQRRWPPGSINLSTLNVAEAERVLIQHALTAADNNRTKAAELLGISVRTLRNKLNGPGRDTESDEE